MIQHKLETFFVIGNFCGVPKNAQVGAFNKEDARVVYQRHFPGCVIESIKSIEDIASETSDRLIECVKQQLYKAKEKL